MCLRKVIVISRHYIIYEVKNIGFMFRECGYI